MFQRAGVVRQRMGGFAFRLLQPRQSFLRFGDLAAQAGGLGFMRFGCAGKLRGAVSEGQEQSFETGSPLI